MAKKICCIVLLIMSLSLSLPVFAGSGRDDKLYKIYLTLSAPASDFDFRDQDKGIVRMGWGRELYVALASRSNIDDSDRWEKIDVVSWDAVMPDGSSVEPRTVTEKFGAEFLVPYETVGNMIVRANVDGRVVAELKVVILSEYSLGKPIRGWRKSFGENYYIQSDGKLARGWLRDAGNWYYMNQDGVAQTGWQYLSYNDKSNWYFFNEDGKMLTGWQRIGNSWYFFKSDGSMAANEWAGGYWLSANGSWKYHPKGSWKYDGKGWWFEDTSGWYPRNTTVKINGVLYSFNSRGYLVE